MEKKAKKTGRDGIDRWTSNGYGITLEKSDTDKEKKRSLNDEFRRFVMSDDLKKE